MGQPWIRGAVFYEIFPDRFSRGAAKSDGMCFESWDSPPTAHGFKGGDFWGVINKLDYLQDMGVTGIYFTPIFASTANHRYHTSDYFQVDPLLGGNRSFQDLLAACRQRGMRVLIDGVFNHASRSFLPFAHTLENGLASPYLDWFHFDRERLARGEQLNAYPPEERLLSKPTQEVGLANLGYRAWWDLAALPKLNTDNPSVREYILRVGEYWLQQGVDGWRLDVPHEIDDDDFWRAFRQRCLAVREDAYLLGELWGDARRWLQGDMFDGTMNYLLGKSILAFALGESLDADVVASCGGYRDIRVIDAAQFAERWNNIETMYSAECLENMMNFIGSHDTPRILTLASGDVQAVKRAFAMLMVMPGAPCIYYGDEIGMRGGHDPECRAGFTWHEQDWNHSLRDSLRHLIQLRRELPALTQAATEVVYAEGDCLALLRGSGADVLVVFNRSSVAAELKLTFEEARNASWRLRLASENSADSKASLLTGLDRFTVQPGSWSIWERVT